MASSCKRTVFAGERFTDSYRVLVPIRYITARLPACLGTFTSAPVGLCKTSHRPPEEPLRSGILFNETLLTQLQTRIPTSEEPALRYFSRSGSATATTRRLICRRSFPLKLDPHTTLLSPRDASPRPQQRRQRQRPVLFLIASPLRKSLADLSTNHHTSPRSILRSRLQPRARSSRTSSLDLCSTRRKLRATSTSKTKPKKKDHQRTTKKQP